MQLLRRMVKFVYPCLGLGKDLAGLRVSRLYYKYLGVLCTRRPSEIFIGTHFHPIDDSLRRAVLERASVG